MLKVIIDHSSQEDYCLLDSIHITYEMKIMASDGTTCAFPAP
jgi:hypothetical protein